MAKNAPNPNPMLDRSLPSSIEAERGVLASILIDNALCYQAIELLKPDDFFRDSHRRIYEKMILLAEQRMPIDPVTLQSALARAGELEQVGGLAFLTSFLDGVGHSSNVESYARIIKGKAMLRRMISVCQQGIASCLDQEDDPESIVDQIEKQIFDIGEDRIRAGFVSVAEVAGPELQRIEDASKRSALLTGLMTNFEEFDRLTNGLQNSDLVIIAARPSMGKTSFCLNLAENIAIQSGKSVGIFSLEMSKESLVTRMLCSQGRVDAQRMRGGYLNKDEWKALGEALQVLAQARIFIDDAPGITVMEMRAKARRLMSQHGLDLLIVDYLQLIRGKGRFENRQTEVSQISRDLKALAKELNVPVIALSQLSRASETRSDHRPQLSDLRESGSIEQDADVVGFIYRDEVYNATEENAGMAELIIAKQRNGPTGTANMAFIKEFTRFDNLWRER